MSDEPEIRYKLTDENGRSKFGDCQWGPGVRYTAPGGGELCTDAYVHVYTDPLLAILLNPMDAEYKHPRLWRCDVAGECKTNCGLKEGWTDVTTTEGMELPIVTREQKMRFGILCSLAVVDKWTDKKAAQRYVVRARAWLDGSDGRNAIAVRAADVAEAAAAREYEAALAAPIGAEGPSSSWVSAAVGAARAAWAVGAPRGAWAAAFAASAAGGTIDLIALAHEAVNGEGK